MSKLGGMPAFPKPSGPYGDQDSIGMTLRQYYAGLAMQGYIIKALEGSTAHTIVAADAVRSADALLAELEKP